MKKRFFMGYDASLLQENEIDVQVKLLDEQGYREAGYQTIRLGDMERFTEDALRRICDKLSTAGYHADLTVKSHQSMEVINAAIEKYHVNMVTIDSMGDREKTETIAHQLQGKVLVAIRVTPEDLPWASSLADIIDFNCITDQDDFFEITRNRLDSCRDGDTDIRKSDANLFTQAMQPEGTWLSGSLPLRFDDYRNEAIFTQYCMLGCPLVLQGDLSAMSDASKKTLQNEKLISLAKMGAGKVTRYYDPWHVLLTKSLDAATVYAMILNRCHGDQPTNILPVDLGWSNRFSVTDLLLDQLVGENLETFEVHVETSDHPKTPCCKLYQMQCLS